MLEIIDGPSGHEVLQRIRAIFPDFADLLLEFGFGRIFGRPQLNLKSREIATIAALTALGTLLQLKVHVRAALHVGLTREEILEIILQMMVYCGAPKALNALFAAEIFNEKN